MTEVSSAPVPVGRYDYPSQWGCIEEDVLSDLLATLRSGPHVLGGRLVAFEEAFARYVGVSECVGVNSGTDALVMALRILGIGPGDEVITQANTFHATVAAIRAVGGDVVLVDAVAGEWTMDVDQVRRAITPATRAILPVHMYGTPAPMPELLDVARQSNIFVIEDCAQAHGARIGDALVGSFGDVGCFSFHPSKNLAAAGDGGAVVTARPELAERARRLRNLGQSTQNEHVELGWNSRLDELQAIILQAKLPHLDAWNDQRAEISRHYTWGLAGLPVTVQPHREGVTPVHHLYQVMSDRRDGLVRHLRSNGIDAVIRYPTPVHRQQAFVPALSQYQVDSFPVATAIAEKCCCLPLHPTMTDREVEVVVEQMRTYFTREDR